MVAFSVIGILVLILIYFVMRTQTLQREVAMTKNSVKASAQKMQDTQRGLAQVLSHLQGVYEERLERGHKSGIVSSESLPVLRFIMQHFAVIAQRCFEQGETVEEALTAALNQQEEVTIEAIRDLIKQQPAQVRMAWVKNTPGGFMVACDSLTKLATGQTIPTAEKAYS